MEETNVWRLMDIAENKNNWKAQSALHALRNFFKILEEKQKQVASDDLDHTLREIAKRYLDLRQQLQAFRSDDPDVNQLRQQAAMAVEAGEFESAEKLLNQARDRDLEAAKQIQEIARKRRGGHDAALQHDRAPFWQ